MLRLTGTNIIVAFNPSCIAPNDATQAISGCVLNRAKVVAQKRRGKKKSIAIKKGITNRHSSVNILYPATIKKPPIKSLFLEPSLG